MKIKEITNSFNYLGFIDNCYLSTTGTLTACYELEMPPIYTLGAVDYTKIFKTFQSTFKELLEPVIVHKQDIFLRLPFDAESMQQGDDFFAKSMRKRFSNTEYMEHKCFLSFSIENLSSLEKAYLANPLKYDKSLHISDRERIKAFRKQVAIVIAGINDLAGFQLKEVSKDIFRAYLLNYYTLFTQDYTIRDFWTQEDYMTNGKKKVIAYAVTEERQLPDSINLFSKDRVFKAKVKSNIDNERNFLQTMFAENLGITFHYSHVLNQIWRFDSKYGNELEVSADKAYFYRTFSSKLEKAAEDLKKLSKEILNSENILCEYSLNCTIIEDSTHFEDAKTEIEALLNVRRIKTYQPSGSGLYNMYHGSMMGFENLLNKSFFFITDLCTALAFNSFGSNYKNDPQGIYFNDRVNNTPILVDLWKAPFGVSLKARNGVIVSSTGGGKSVLALNIIDQYTSIGWKSVVIEFGKSFYFLCKKYGDRAIHIDYNKETKLGYNPFDLGNKKKPDTDMLKELSDLIIRFMQLPNNNLDRKAQSKTVEDLIQFYYEKSDIKKHSFESFYRFVETDRINIDIANIISPSYFSIDRFLLVGKDFLPGGRYENICTPGDMHTTLYEKDLIVIELTQVKKDRFLCSFIMYVISTLIDNILMDRKVKSIVFFDEYGETQDLKDEQNDFDIQSTTAYCYQKLRKENSAAYIAIQHLKQLKEGSYTDTILTQTDLLYVPETKQSIYNQVVDIFSIDNPTTINMLYSMSSNLHTKNFNEAYSEVFIKVGDNFATVVRICLSEERFLAYQTDGELWERINSQLPDNNIEEIIKSEVKLLQ